MIAGTLEVQMLANMARLAKDMEDAKRTVGSAMKEIDRAVGQAKSALEALGVGLSLAGFGALIKSSIDLQDHLNDLSKTTRIAVEDLAGLRLASKQSGSDLDAVAQSIGKMSVNIGKDSERFAALGITAKSPLEAFKQLADVLGDLEDPELRAAVAAGALGKSWMGAMPLLSEGSQRIEEMVARGRELHGITAALAQQADEFNDKLAELTGTGGLLHREVGALLPLLNTLADALLEMQHQAGQGDNQFHVLLETFKAVVVLGSYVKDVFYGIGVEIGGWAAQIAALARFDFAGFAAIRKEMTADAEKNRAAFDAWIQKVMELGTAMDKAGAAKAGAKDPNSPLFEFAGGGVQGAGAAARAKAFLDTGKDVADNDAAYRNLVKTLKEKLLVDAQHTELAKLQLALQALSTKQLETITPERRKELEDLARKVDLLAAEKKAMQLNAKAFDVENAAREETARLRAEEEDKKNKALKSAFENLEQMEFENTLIGKTNVERETAIALRQIEKSEIDKTTESYTTLIEGIKKAIGNREALKEQEQAQIGLWQSIERTAHDTFVSIWQSGKSAFDRLRDTLKNGLYDLLYQMTLKKWIINIATSLSGAGVATSAIGSSADAVGGLGLIGSLANFGSTSAWGSIATSEIGTSLGLSGMTESGLMMSGLGRTIGTAIPYVGAALLAAQALGLFKGGGAPKPADLWLQRDAAGSFNLGQDNVAGGAGNLGYYETIRALLNDPTKFDQSKLESMVGTRVSGAPGTGPEALVQALMQQLDPAAQAAAKAVADLAKETELANTRLQWQNQLDVLLGKKTQLQVEHEQSLVGVTDEATIALINQVFGLKQEAAARDAAAEATRATTQAEKDLADARRSANDAAIQTLATARDAVWSAYDTEAQKLQTLAEKMAGFGKSLRELQASLAIGDMSPASPMGRFGEAQRQFRDLARRAQMGDADALAALGGSAQSYLQLGRGAYSSGDQYSAIYAEVQAALGGAAGTAERTADNTTQQLTYLRSQVEQLVGIRAGVMTLSQAMSAFTDVLRTGNLSFTGGVTRNLGASIGNARSLLNAGNLRGVYDLAIATGITSGQLEAALGFAPGSANAWARSQNLPSFDVGTPFVPYDMTARLHYGERVVTRADNDGLIERLDRVIGTLEQLCGDVHLAADRNAARITAASDQVARRAEAVDRSRLNRAA